jgi:transcriptional regulator
MHAPEPFAVTDADMIDAMIRRARLGVLVTSGAEGLCASHLPLLWDAERRRLCGHLARANPQRASAHAEDALVILSGADAYVSPSAYASKAEHGRVVPTWNYEAVHLWGRVEWFEEPDRLRRLLAGLTGTHEAARASPWSVDDAPADYVTRMLAAIVGVELVVTRIEAVSKLSQNRSPADRDGVAAALGVSADPRDREIAARMTEVERAADRSRG